MKKLLLFVVVMLGMSIGSVAHAQNLQNFTVQSFSADYYLTRDDKNVAQVQVVERIVVEFPSFDQNHGIERAIPQTYKDAKLNLSITSITHADGTAWHYTTYSQNDNLVARIGDANRYVHGEQTFIITYNLRGVMTFYNDHDEWYWDINGNQWQQPIATVIARIHLPNQLADKITKNTTCYTGYYGQSGKDCTVTTDQDSSARIITVSSTRGFSAGENMSFVMGFAPGTFEAYRLDLRLIILVAIYMVLSFLLPVGVSFIVMYRLWRTSGRDPKGKGIVIPQYKPQKDMNPLLADIILNEKMQTKAISAAILDLCVNGYLKIYEITKKKILKDGVEYELELIKPADTLNADMQKVAKMLFTEIDAGGVGARVNISDKSQKLYIEAASLDTAVNNTVSTLGYFVMDPSKARKRYTWVSVVMGIASFVLFGVLQPWMSGFAVGLFIGAAIITIFRSIMPARTVKGVEAKEYLLGLKDYMELAEKDRIKFLQGPDTAEKVDVTNKKKLVKLYEKLLPYAMLFGIEKQWAKEFANLYQSDGSPDWYVGRGAFNAVALSNAVSNFNSAAVSSFTPPSSSGSSGFSSGGFSGGGGGGGGGGGW